MFAFRPDRGWVGVVTGRHAGGAMARLLLPLAVGAPLLLGFFTLRGQQVEVFGAAAGFATFAVACAVVLAVVVLWTARSLGRADLENARLYGEAVLERARLATVLEQLPRASSCATKKGGWSSTTRSRAAWRSGRTAGSRWSSPMAPTCHRSSIPSGGRSATVRR
ncbi:MAG: hypothetical protein M5U28_25870 [Sandaracinaceae bacterium]|nr:hypothetical protein [Sandaracinaceae bacterium]